MIRELTDDAMHGTKRGVQIVEGGIRSG